MTSPVQDCSSRIWDILTSFFVQWEEEETLHKYPPTFTYTTCAPIVHDQASTRLGVNIVSTAIELVPREWPRNAG